MREPPGEERPRLLDPLDRISEVLFGLIMAVTIVGSLSIASAGKAEVRTVMARERASRGIAPRVAEAHATVRDLIYKEGAAELRLPEGRVTIAEAVAARPTR
jgi:hypothetical protein